MSGALSQTEAPPTTNAVPLSTRNLQSSAEQQTVSGTDTKSEASYDPLFDDEPDADGESDGDTTMVSMATQKGSNLPAPSKLPAARAAATAPVPKNAPPLLTRNEYSSFSSNMLMIASIDGQVVLWDRRANTPQRGVGRLEMNEKTAPWCVSVSPDRFALLQ